MIINHQRLQGLQAFKEKHKNEYLIVDLNSGNGNPQGHLDAIATAIESNVSSLCISTVSWEFLEENCTEVSWKKIPKTWQDGFLQRLSFPEKKITPQENTKQLKLF